MTLANPLQERIARLLAARHEVLEFLGEGGFAAVFQVVNPRLGRIEALKVLNADHSEEPDFARRFEQEARVAASLARDSERRPMEAPYAAAVRSCQLSAFSCQLD